MKLKGSVGGYLKAIEEEIERIKHQIGSVPEWREQRSDWEAYLNHLENMKIEVCLLMDFEEEDEINE